MKMNGMQSTFKRAISEKTKERKGMNGEGCAVCTCPRKK